MLLARPRAGLAGIGSASSRGDGVTRVRLVVALSLFAVASSGVVLFGPRHAGKSGQAASPGKNGKIVFARAGDLWTIEPGGTGLARLTHTPKRSEVDPAWSPDGTKLAYDDGLLVFVAGADGSGATDITTPSIKGNETYFGGGGCDNGPTWSPDGGLIAVSAIVDGCTGAAGEIDAMTPSGTNRRVIEQDYEGLLGGDNQPAWAPGGKRIVFTRSDSFRMASGPYFFNLYVLNAKTGKVLSKLTKDNHSSSPNFSPDGRQIVFVDRGKVTVRTAAGKLVPLAAGRDPAWSPDGKKIVYVGPGGLRLMKTNGAGNRLLLRCSCSGPDWQRRR